MKNHSKPLSTYLACIPPPLPGWISYYFSVLDSTHAFLKRLPSPTMPTLCFCDLQTAGQGRNGRWHSSFNGNLYLSWLFPSFYFRTSLSLEIALSIAKVFSGIPLLIKWPNDFILNDKKVGGLLIEKSTDRLIVGVGLNLASVPNVPNACYFLATSFQDAGFFLTRQALIIPLTKAVNNTVLTINPKWHVDWQGQDFLLNKHIAWQTIWQNFEETEFGQALGIKEDGALMVKTRHTKKALYSAKNIKVL